MGSEMCIRDSPVRVSILGYDCCITKRRPHDDFLLFVSLGVIMVIRNRNRVLRFSTRETARNSPFFGTSAAVKPMQDKLDQLQKHF